jgi:hypothetical protein
MKRFNKYRRGRDSAVCRTNILIQAENEYILCHDINRVTKDLIICLHANGLAINTETPTAMIFHTWQLYRFPTTGLVQTLRVPGG